MADDQQFCLRWNNFQTNFTSQFQALRVEEDFVDVTLACEGRRIKAHKLVLSACSPYFKELFKENPCKHPIIFMQDVEYEQLMNLVEFMYAGQVNVCQNKLPTFLHVAESLQIRGLSQSQNKLSESEEKRGQDVRAAATFQKEGADLLSSPEGSLTEEASYPSSKRVCVSVDSNSLHSQESNSYAQLPPTTALIETKMEPMDYYSDGEIKPNLSKSHTGDRTGYLLQGSLDSTGNFSAQSQEPSQEPLQDVVGEMCRPHSLEGTPVSDSLKPHSLDPRPCPECGRVYSNISNLRQHIRLIHHPECITCPLCFKPFKNKLYLRRHVMSYHDISLPSQNDMRYKYALMNKSASGEGVSRNISTDITSLFSATKQDNTPQSHHNKDTAPDKKIPSLMHVQRSTRSKSLTDSKVPNSI